MFPFHVIKQRVFQCIEVNFLIQLMLDHLVLGLLLLGLKIRIVSILKINDVIFISDNLCINIFFIPIILPLPFITVLLLIFLSLLQIIIS